MASVLRPAVLNGNKAGRVLLCRKEIECPKISVWKKQVTNVLVQDSRMIRAASADLG
jgi:hypothetical protein